MYPGITYIYFTANEITFSDFFKARCLLEPGFQPRELGTSLKILISVFRAPLFIERS